MRWCAHSATGPCTGAPANTLSSTALSKWHPYSPTTSAKTKSSPQREGWIVRSRCELREDYALRKIPTASFAANALYLEIVRLAYNLVTAFQRNCLEESWQSF